MRAVRHPQFLAAIGEAALYLARTFGFALAVSLPLVAQAQTPFHGSPMALPATFEAEDFDLGGEGVAYHDTTAGNAGGQYRMEDVDIFVSNDPAGGGYIIKNFETGEWLGYTVSVPARGNYDIEVRASTHIDFPNTSYHIEIDGVNVTGTVVLPTTNPDPNGGWDNFQWLGRRTIVLDAGTHFLKVVSEQPYFGFNAIRVTAAPTPTAFSGTPIPVPGTFEAENFDLGGEGVAYHDTTAGNQGGQYRTEDVDIFVSDDPAGGGYIIKNFETGEWLNYTINVPTTGNYDIEVRVSTHIDFPNTSYHLEIDGVNVTGTVVLPTTNNDPNGGWSNFEWLGKRTVHLAAGTRFLKIVSEQPYFGFNAIRVTATPASPPQSLLFWSGFEPSTALNAPTAGGTANWWQDIQGLDSTTGYQWPATIWGGTNRFQLIVSDVSKMINRIEAGTGRNGSQALYMENMEPSGNCQPVCTQDVFLHFPDTSVPQGDLYVSFWLKLQDDLVQKMTDPAVGGQTWRALFEWKTSADYRVIVNVASWHNGCGGDKPNGPLFWEIAGDNGEGGGHQEIWKVQNCSIAVPVVDNAGNPKWFKLEVFWHRSAGSDGRVWVAVDDQVIADRWGPNMGVNNNPIDRIFIPTLYTHHPVPWYQWVDDVQIWDGFPPACSTEDWCDPPYAAH